MSDSLRPHEPQHTKPPCPLPTPGVHSDSRPLSQWCHLTTSSSVVPFPPAPNPSQHQSLFQRVNSLHEVAMSFSFSIIPSKEIPGLISFRMDWLDLLAVQGILKSLLQHHSSKASILRCSAFFTAFRLFISYINPGLIAQLVKNPPAMWETWVWSLGWEDPLERGKATHSSILAWRIPRTV